jgi:uncharacterized protein YktA (UPF0223 family)
MWLEKIFSYMLLLLKHNIISGGIVFAIVIYFFPTAGLIIGGFWLLGVFIEAYKDFKEIVPKLEYEHLRKLYNKASDEFEGFDEMLRIVQRNM